MYLILFFIYFSYFQFTVVGLAGVSGAHVQELVGMASSTVGDTVTILFPMEEGNAMEPTSGHALAASNLAQVNFTFFGLKTCSLLPSKCYVKGVHVL